MSLLQNHHYHLEIHSQIAGIKMVVASLAVGDAGASNYKEVVVKLQILRQNHDVTCTCDRVCL